MTKRARLIILLLFLAGSAWVLWNDDAENCSRETAGLDLNIRPTFLVVERTSGWRFRDWGTIFFDDVS
jgi:hypothetical protein